MNPFGHAVYKLNAGKTNLLTWAQQLSGVKNFCELLSRYGIRAVYVGSEIPDPRVHVFYLRTNTNLIGQFRNFIKMHDMLLVDTPGVVGGVLLDPSDRSRAVHVAYANHTGSIHIHYRSDMNTPVKTP